MVPSEGFLTRSQNNEKNNMGNVTLGPIRTGISEE